MRTTLLAICLVLSACGGGGSDSPAAPVLAPAVAPVAPPVVAPVAPPMAQPAVVPVQPRAARLAAWGDSLTNDYSRTLKSLLPDTEVFHGGVGAQTSTQIASRQGAVVPVMRLAGDLIPASGPVQVIAQSVTMQTEQGPGDLTGSLAGVHGTMKRSTAGVYTFTRDAPGDAVSINAPGERFTVDAFGRRNWPTIFWYGRNNSTDPQQILADLAASVAFLEPGTDYLVLSILNWSTEPAGSPGHDNIERINAAIAAAYPGHFFEMRRYLVAQYDPNQPQDVTDHANDVTPTSLRRDALHMNPKGSMVLATKLKELIAARGW